MWHQLHLHSPRVPLWHAQGQLYIYLQHMLNSFGARSVGINSDNICWCTSSLQIQLTDIWKSDHQVPIETVQGHGENTCKLSKKGSKSVLFCRYLKGNYWRVVHSRLVCVCVCVCHQCEVIWSCCICISISYPWFTDSDTEDEARLTFVNWYIEQKWSEETDHIFILFSSGSWYPLSVCEKSQNNNYFLCKNPDLICSVIVYWGLCVLMCVCFTCYMDK